MSFKASHVICNRCITCSSWDDLCPTIYSKQLCNTHAVHILLHNLFERSASLQHFVIQEQPYFSIYMQASCSLPFLMNLPLQRIACMCCLFSCYTACCTVTLHAAEFHVCFIVAPCLHCSVESACQHWSSMQQSSWILPYATLCCPVVTLVLLPGLSWKRHTLFFMAL